MPLQNNVLSRARPHPEGATTGPPPDATATVQTVGRIPLDPLERFQQGQFRAYYQFLLEELASGPYWSDMKSNYGQVHKDGPGSTDHEEETGSETGY